MSWSSQSVNEQLYTTKQFSFSTPFKCITQARIDCQFLATSFRNWLFDCCCSVGQRRGAASYTITFGIRIRIFISHCWRGYGKWVEALRGVLCGPLYYNLTDEQLGPNRWTAHSIPERRTTTTTLEGLVGCCSWVALTIFTVVVRSLDSEELPFFLLYIGDPKLAGLLSREEDSPRYS